MREAVPASSFSAAAPSAPGWSPKCRPYVFVYWSSVNRSRNRFAAATPLSMSSFWSASVRLNCVVPIVPASTAIVRTRVEFETKRASHASCAVWKIWNPNRAAHGRCATTLFTPEPTPFPPVSVKPNVGRVSGPPVVSTSNSQTGKFESVPPSMIVEACSFHSCAVRSRVVAVLPPAGTPSFAFCTSSRSFGALATRPSVSPTSVTKTRSRTSVTGSKK